MNKKQQIIELRRKAAYEAKIEKDRVVRLLEQAKTGGGSAIKKVITQLVDTKKGNGGARTKKKNKKIKIPKPDVVSTCSSPSSLQDIYDDDDKEFLNLLPQPNTVTKDSIDTHGCRDNDYDDATSSPSSADQFQSPYV